MKKLLSALFYSCAVFTTLAQYTLDWYSIHGGGGISSNSQFSITGILGRPDAGGAMTGGNYTLTGGAASLIALVQTPGAPRLALEVLGPNTLKILWPSSEPGWVLQRNTNLASATNWINAGLTEFVDGTNRHVTVSPDDTRLFFRLMK